MNAIEIVFLTVGIAGLLFAISAAGMALERRKARKLAASLLGQPCPFCASPFGPDTIRSARPEHGFEDDDVSVVCTHCSKTVMQFERDREALSGRPPPHPISRILPWAIGVVLVAWLAHSVWRYW